ncbi:MAG: hypothetical protein FWF59_11675 [Turicibacter sp.]|nr:hypothetical protein [Turicibacter sp.]
MKKQVLEFLEKFEFPLEGEELPTLYLGLDEGVGLSKVEIKVINALGYDLYDEDVEYVTAEPLSDDEIKEEEL